MNVFIFIAVLVTTSAYNQIPTGPAPGGAVIDDTLIYSYCNTLGFPGATNTSVYRVNTGSTAHVRTTQKGMKVTVYGDSHKNNPVNVCCRGPNGQNSKVPEANGIGMCDNAEGELPPLDLLWFDTTEFGDRTAWYMWISSCQPGPNGPGKGSQGFSVWGSNTIPDGNLPLQGRMQNPPAMVNLIDGGTDPALNVHCVEYFQVPGYGNYPGAKYRYIGVSGYSIGVKDYSLTQGGWTGTILIQEMSWGPKNPTKATKAPKPSKTPISKSPTKRPVSKKPM